MMESETMDEKKKSIIKKGFWILVVLSMFAFVSYAAFTYNRLGTRKNQIATGTLLLTLDDEASNGISINPAIPVSDGVGSTEQPYTFTLENTGSLTADYQLFLVEDTQAYEDDDCIDNKMDWKALRYSFEKDSEDPTTNSLSDSPYMLDHGSLKSGATYSYTLHVWINQDAGNEVMGTHFHGKIQVKAVQEGQEYTETE